MKVNNKEGKVSRVPVQNNNYSLAVVVITICTVGCVLLGACKTLDFAVCD